MVYVLIKKEMQEIYIHSSNAICSQEEEGIIEVSFRSVESHKKLAPNNPFSYPGKEALISSGKLRSPAPHKKKSLSRRNT